MMERCLSVAEFADYLTGDQRCRGHLACCARCRSIAAALERTETITDLEAVRAVIEGREAAADVAVARLEAQLPHLWSVVAAADSRLHRPEGIRRLLQRASASFSTTPRRSLALARVAANCAATDGVAPSLRFEALKEVAKYSLLAAGDFDGALAVLAEAEGVVRMTDEPSLSAAILANARAFIFGDPSCARWERALALLDVAEPVFAQLDVNHWRGARHLRAAILLRRGDYAEAAALYHELLAGETSIVSRAHLTKDLAECLCRMGRAAEALPLASDALEVFVRHAADAGTVARAMWGWGHALVGVGRHDEAIQTLDRVSRMFAATGQNDDELGAELSAIDAMLAKDPTDDVGQRLRSAYLLACALDAEQPLRSGAQRAALWAALRSAYATKGLTPAVMAHASEYLRTLGRGDEVPFVPLQ